MFLKGVFGIWIFSSSFFQIFSELSFPHTLSQPLLVFPVFLSLFSGGNKQREKERENHSSSLFHPSFFSFSNRFLAIARVGTPEKLLFQTPSSTTLIFCSRCRSLFRCRSHNSLIKIEWAHSRCSASRCIWLVNVWFNVFCLQPIPINFTPALFGQPNSSWFSL